MARDDLLRHIRALGLREWQAPDENPRDVSTITNRLSMTWPRLFFTEEARLSFEALLLSIEAGCQRNSSF